MKSIVVFHDSYGCATGCCGHVVRMLEDGEEIERFEFAHPFYESELEFVERMVIQAFGQEHCADINFDECIVSTDE